MHGRVDHQQSRIHNNWFYAKLAKRKQDMFEGFDNADEHDPEFKSTSPIYPQFTTPVL
jgi:hypothetical protein